MDKFIVFIGLTLMVLLVSACAAQPTSPPAASLAAPASLPTDTPEAQEVEIQPPAPSATLVPSPTAVSSEAQMGRGSPTADATCLAQENPIARQIVADYPRATYEQVMYWRCSGASFEDILTALQTEELLPPQEDATAQDMLEWLAQGLTWNEIWQVLHLTE